MENLINDIDKTLESSNEMWIKALESDERTYEYVKIIGFLEGRLRTIRMELMFNNQNL